MSFFGVYPSFPTLFWGLSRFFVNDLICGSSCFPRCGGRVLCVHGAVSFHRAHLYQDRRVLLQSTLTMSKPPTCAGRTLAFGKTGCTSLGNSDIAVFRPRSSAAPSGSTLCCCLSVRDAEAMLAQSRTSASGGRANESYRRKAKKAEETRRKGSVGRQSMPRRWRCGRRASPRVPVPRLRRCSGNSSGGA